ncbi:MAG: Cna B-type domain-containing protein [Lachnospiraceae bacterium]|nr:Cna B-type domain-containing protein [Lachnospiraceae bacterium]
MMKKIISTILSLALLVSMIPTSVMPVYADAVSHDVALSSVAGKEYIADADAIWSYKDYFKSDSTEYAGAVWTDKSVFTKSDSLTSKFEISKDSTGADATISIADDNFLVSLSALGATKEVLGYSNLPSDTVLILDVSNSMESSELTSMVEATNKAIDELLNLNLHNRVGVVVYGTDASVLLPIDRYTTTKTAGYGEDAYNVYLEIASNQSYGPQTGRQIRTARTISWGGYGSTTYNVTDSSNNTVNRYINTGGSTYIQGGMYQAETLFEAVEDTEIETGLIQGGTKRIPIVVLMSDGAPTRGATNYTQATNNNRNLGNGTANSISDYLVFPAQLTAAHLRSQIEKKYGRESLFYTLGYDVEHAEARRVLDPLNNTSDTVSGWWTKYESTAVNSQIADYSYGNNTITRVESATDTLTANRYYSDQYFPASNTSGLLEAFDKIVSQIVIQSKYYPTLVESGEYELDGYITFEDELGRYVEVKSMKGLVIGEVLFTGAAFTNALTQTDKFGNASTWTEYGEEFLVSVQERLNIRNDQARALLATAWRSTDNQLTQDHFIGWYADASGNYLGHWDTKAHTALNYPEGTKYLNKCYFFYGELDEEYGHVEGGDMMYIIVQVHKDITTGEECVIFKVPASLVPMTKYTVEVNSNSFDTATEVKLTMDEESPIRLLFEVGILDEINEINLMKYMAKESHTHPVKDGNNNTVGYAFYSNRWGVGHILDGSGVTDKLDPNNHLAVVSHYHPSLENERYYYTEDSYIYSDESGTLYTGTAAPTGDGYYHRYRIIKTTVSGSTNAEISYKYVPVDSAVLAATGDLAITKDDKGWYIPAGQIYQQIARHRVEKKDIAENNDNITGTLTYYDYPVLIHPTSASEDYHIYDFLGNNGRLIMYSAQGIKLSKTIDDAAVAAGTETFKFDITLTNKEVPATLKILDADGKELVGRHVVSTDNKTVTVDVKNAETIYIIGLETGTTYTVTEQRHESYRVKEVTGTASGTIIEYTLNPVTFVNTASSHMGDLVVTKTVTHDYGDEYVVPKKVFEVVVELGAGNASKEFDATGTVNNGTAVAGKLTTDGSGKITLELGHEDSVTIKGIPENTEYTVTETVDKIPTGFEQKTDTASLTGTIISDQTVRADLVNEYTVSDKNATTLSITGTKTISGREWEDADSFAFQLQEYVSGWQNVEGATGTATKTNSNFSINTTFEYATPGIHYYRVIEVEPDAEHKIAGMAYDNTVYNFRVTVADADMDGYLEVTASDIVTVSGTGDAYTITLNNANFTNIYHQAVATINISKNLINETGVEISKSDFVFGLYIDEACEQKVFDGPNPDPVTVSSGVGGTAVINRVYNSTTVEPHIYYLKEIAGDIVGMTYDPTIYQVEINVTGDDAIGFTAATTIKEKVGESWTAVAGNVAVFDNTYALDTVATPVEITGTKVFNGPASMAKDFAFAIYKTNADFAVANNATALQTVNNNAGSIKFTDVERYTKVGHYYYVVKEVPGTNPAITYDDTEYHVTVHVVPHEEALQEGETAQAKLVIKSITINEVGGTGNQIAFENTYTIREKAKITINGDKDVTGKNITADEFTFGLYNDDSCTTPVADATGKTEAKSAAISGAFSFDFEYASTGTYTYYIKEIPGEIEYKEGEKVIGTMSYDSTVYQVVITVTDNGQGVLSATKSITKVGESAEADLKFTNVYDPTDVTGLKFNFTKTFIENATNTDITTWPVGGFQFALYEANDKYEITNSTPAITASASDKNAVEVVLPTYNAAGTFYYVFKELPLEDHTISYDSTEHHIMVTVTDYGTGELRGSVYVNGRVNDSASFRNIHTTVYADDIIRVKKEFTNETGVEISMDTFKFGLFTDEACTVPATFEGVEVTSMADMNGDASFYFQYNDSFLGTTVTSKVDTYYVAEIIPASAIPGMIYDKSVYKVDVTITYDKTTNPTNPTLTASQNITKIIGANGVKLDNPVSVTDITFDNTYKLSNALFTLKGHKVFQNTTGANMAVEDDKFTFELYEATVNTAADKWTIGTLKDSVENQGNLFTFNISDVNKAGTYYYVIKESAKDALTGVTYDNTEYRVIVEVTAGSSAELIGNVKEISKVTYDDKGNETVTTLSANDQIVFINTYNPSVAPAIISAKKVLHNAELTANAFEFELVDASGKVVATATNDATGNITFAPQMFDKAGEYQYSIREVKGNIEHVTYDTTEFTVKVVVEDNLMGNLVANVEYQSEPVFENTYTPPTPNPGVPAEPDPEPGDEHKIHIFTKIWDDNNNAAGKRPSSIMVSLYCNGIYASDIELCEANNWTCGLILMSINDGEEVVWTIEEKNVPAGYTASYNQEIHTVTNTYVGSVSANGTKTGDDSNLALFGIIAVVALIALAGIAVLLIKFKKKDEHEE